MADIQISKGGPSNAKVANSKMNKVIYFFKNDYPTIFGAVGTGYASHAGYLPEGAAGLYAGVGLFGAIAYAALWAKHIVKPIELKAPYKGHALKLFVAGLVASTVVTLFPWAVKTGLDDGVYSADSPAVALAYKDAKWLGDKNNSLALAGNIPDPVVSSMAKLIDAPTRFHPSADSPTTSLFPENIIGAAPTGKVDTSSKLFCAVYAANDGSFGGHGVLKLRADGKDYFTPYSAQWQSSTAKADIAACKPKPQVRTSLHLSR